MANQQHWTSLLDRHLDMVAAWYDRLTPKQEITFGLTGLAATTLVILKATAIILGGN